VGDGFAIMIETHALLNGEVAVKMANRLAPLGITWYEEPAGPENAETLAALRRRLPSGVPVCVGERHYTRFGFRDVLEKHVCDVVMPDITRCGGPSEMKRIATMAEAYNVLIAPHNPNGPLSTLASAHVCASIPNFFRCEFMLNDVPWRDEVITEPLDVRGGFLHLSDRPGLGVDLDRRRTRETPGRARDERPGGVLCVTRITRGCVRGRVTRGGGKKSMALSIDLGGRVALVTGVTDGIGVGIARKLAEAGCDVAGCGRRGAGSAQARRFVRSSRDSGGGRSTPRRT
jgi:hypothetical protein